MRKKYANKTPFKRFLHKYTGVIVLVAILIPLGSYIAYSESQEVFFESWNCIDIMTLIGDELSPKENIRLSEIVKECVKEPFSP